MLSTILSAFTVPEIRKKLAFVFFILALYRLGANIPVPGVSLDAVESVQEQFGGGGILNLLNVFSGGGLSQFAIFALGIMPYITASIILQLLTVVVPSLEKLQKDQSPESVFFLIDALIVLAGLLLVVMGHSLWMVFLPLVIIYAIYRIAVRTGRLWYNGRSLLWRCVLFLGRALSWRTINGKDRVASTLRGPEFDDQQLGQLKGLDELQVLDLEGTSVTDAGLEQLKHLRNLQFLVLRKTRVTADGVWRLQQTIPGTCIWY